MGRRLGGDHRFLDLYDLVASPPVVFPSHANDRQHLYQTHLSGQRLYQLVGNRRPPKCNYYLASVP